MHKYMSRIFVVGGIAFVVAGRLATFHNTEMEALFSGWKYWLAAVSCAVLAVASLWLSPKQN